MQKNDDGLTIELGTEKEKTQTLRKSVEACLVSYFKHMEGHNPSDVYKMVFDEVELAVLTFMMKYVSGNQSRASELLGINRGTLRKKLRQYQLME